MQQEDPAIAPIALVGDVGKLALDLQTFLDHFLWEFSTVGCLIFLCKINIQDAEAAELPPPQGIQNHDQGPVFYQNQRDR